MVGLVASKPYNIWKQISHIQKLISIYQNDFNKQNKKLEEKLGHLQLHIQRKKESKIDIKELNDFCISEWKKVINKAIEDMTYNINNRDTKGSEFSEIKPQLQKISDDISVEEFTIDNYEKIYENDLKGFSEQIKEKIDIEKYNDSRYWDGIKIGFISGVIISLIIWALQMWFE